VLYVADNRYFIMVFETDLADSINKKCSKGCGNGWSSSVGKARKSKHIREQLLLCIYSQVSTDKRVKVQNVDSATCCACCINASVLEGTISLGISLKPESSLVVSGASCIWGCISLWCRVRVCVFMYLRMNVCSPTRPTYVLTPL